MVHRHAIDLLCSQSVLNNRRPTATRVVVEWVVSPDELLSGLFTERVEVLLLEAILKMLRVVELRLRGIEVVILASKLHALELVVVEADVQRIR